MGLTLLDGILLVLSGTLATLLIASRSYASEKGKNLATREDLNSVTRAIEDIKAEALSAVEREKSSLLHAQLVNRTQYELELAAYREVWLSLLPVQRAAAALRPIMDQGLAPGETEESRKRERLRVFGESFNPFSEAVWKHRPFYPEEVFLSLNELLRLMHVEAIEYQVLSADRTRDYWEKSMANAKAINDQVEAVAGTIRGRLSRARVA